MPYNGGGSGGTFAGEVVLDTGSAAVPALRFAATPLAGFYSDQSRIMIQGAGGGKISFIDNQLELHSGLKLQWSTNANPWDTQDTFLGRDTAATLQMGADVDGAAVAQTFKAHDGITGTDIAGADFTIAGGRGTGAGTGGNLRRQTSPSLGTGTTAHTLADRELVVAKSKSLTAGVATGFVRIACPQGSVTGGAIYYSIEANDGTNYQCRSGVLPFSIVNPTGTEVGTVGTVGAATEVVAVSTGTLTNTFTIASNAADTMDILANAVSSLTETTLRISFSVVKNHGAGAITAL